MSHQKEHTQLVIEQFHNYLNDCYCRHKDSDTYELLSSFFENFCDEFEIKSFHEIIPNLQTLLNRTETWTAYCNPPNKHTPVSREVQVHLNEINKQTIINIVFNGMKDELNKKMIESVFNIIENFKCNTI
jgi:hypothetical protein